MHTFYTYIHLYQCICVCRLHSFAYVGQSSPDRSQGAAASWAVAEITGEQNAAKHPIWSGEPESHQNSGAKSQGNQKEITQFQGLEFRDEPDGRKPTAIAIYVAFCNREGHCHPRLRCQ